MKRGIFAAGMVCALLVVGRAQAGTINSLVVFGDSLSDTGNVFQASSLSGAPFPPTPPYGGLPVTTSPGRFTNGPVWVEYLAGHLGIAPPAPRGVFPAPAGTNYAWGGAASGLQAVTYTSTLGFPLGGSQPMGSQVAQYLNDRLTGQAPAPDNDTLFVLWGGANEFLLTPNPSPAASVLNLRLEMEALSLAGASHFLVLNLPALSPTPAASGVPSAFIAQDAPVASIDSLVDDFNRRLDRMLNRFESTHRNATVHRLDVFDLFNDVLDAPDDFGLSNTTVPVLNEAALFGAGQLVIQADPATSLFWDGVHPTTTAHSIIGDHAFQVVSNMSVPQFVPEPATILVTSLGFSATVFTRGRRA